MAERHLNATGLRPTLNESKAPARSAFCSGRLPTEHFDRRFADDNLAFWIPRLINAARIDSGHTVLDVGCGTGGFTLAIATETAATLIGVDKAPQFVAFATERASSGNLSVEFLHADATALPFPDESVDRVLLSLVLHQLDEPHRAVREAFRVSRPTGIVLVRSISPDDAVVRVPERFVPSMATADARRMPTIAALTTMLREAGFARLDVECHRRNKALQLDEEIAALRAEVAGRYSFVPDAEVEHGIRRMTAEVDGLAGRPWIDPRATYLIVAQRPGAERGSP